MPPTLAAGGAIPIQRIIGVTRRLRHEDPVFRLCILQAYTSQRMAMARNVISRAVRHSLRCGDLFQIDSFRVVVVACSSHWNGLIWRWVRFSHRQSPHAGAWSTLYNVVQPCHGFGQPAKAHNAMYIWVDPNHLRLMSTQACRQDLEEACGETP